MTYVYEKYPRLMYDRNGGYIKVFNETEENHAIELGLRDSKHHDDFQETKKKTSRKGKR